MTKPSVLFINRVYPPARGATGRVLRDLAHAMARAGWSVSVLTTGPKSGEEKDGSVTVHRVAAPDRPRRILSLGWVWLRLLLKGMRLPRRDLVVTLTDPPMLVVAGRILAAQKKMRHIHWCHDIYPDLLKAFGMALPPPLPGYLRKLSRRSMKSCERVIVIGRCMAKRLTHTGVEAARISVIPNWPEREVIVPSRPPGKPRPQRQIDGARPMAELLKDESPKFRVLYAGNIGRAHPMRTVLDAAAMLADHPEIEFTFVGDGSGHEWLAQERARLDLQNIKFLPFQPTEKMREILESGDVHLVSLRTDAAGMLVPCKFYSTLAVGRPCIYVGPETTEIARVISDFHAGSIVPQGDAALLAQTILDYRNDGDKWFTAQEGASQAGNTYTPDEALQAWIARANDVMKTYRRA